MMKAEVTVKKRPACHLGRRCVQTYTTCGTHNYKCYNQVSVTLLQKIHSVICPAASAFSTAEENMSQKEKSWNLEGLTSL